MERFLEWLPRLLFFGVFLTGVGIFVYRVRWIYRVIRSGKPEHLSLHPGQILRNFLRYAVFQEKMFRNRLVGILHFLTFAGFFFVNLEMIEVFTDALLGTHRFFASILGSTGYSIFIALQEVFAVFVLVSCLIFVLRRVSGRIRRFQFREIDRKSRWDALFILIAVIFLMVLILLMNGADYARYLQGNWQVMLSFPFPVSGPLLASWLQHFPESTLHLLQQVGWWGHNLLMFGLLAYLPGSKHLHMIFAFINTALTPPHYPNKPGKMQKVEGMEQILAVLTGSAEESSSPDTPERFGARDVLDLTWKQILEAFTCTECGRCTDACPAATTGKALSPRKIVMNVRDRAEQIIAHWKQHGTDSLPEGSLLDLISREELYACTTCMACVEACPVNIHPLRMILDIRRHLVLDEGQAPREWVLMFQNLENNGAPWQFPLSERVQWLKTPENP